VGVRAAKFQVRACVLGTLVTVVLLAGCTSGSEADLRVDGGPDDFHGVPAGVASGPDNTGWLVAAEGSELRLYTFDGSTLDFLVRLPNWHAVQAHLLGNEVIVGGIRCSSATCDRTVAELVRVNRAGDVRVVATLGEHAGPPDDANSISIVGATSGVLWVIDMQGELQGLADDGSLVAGPFAVGGEPCVINDRLYLLRSSASVPPGTPTGTGIGSPTGFQVFGLTDSSALDEVPGGELPPESSPGSIGFCRSGAFEVPSQTDSAVWEPDAGWTAGAPAAQLDAGYGLATSSSRNEYSVGPDGVLRMRSESRWLETPLTFSLRTGGPPLALAVDDAGGEVVACVSHSDGEETSNKVECDTAPWDR
jgi:hypothetical protein